STCSWRRRTAPSGTATSCADSPSGRPTFSSCFGTSCAAEFAAQHDRKSDERKVADEEVPRPGRRVLKRKRPVVRGKPGLRQAERHDDEGADRESHPSADERDEWDEPDQVLRREDLVEGDERTHGRRSCEEHFLCAGTA